MEQKPYKALFHLATSRRSTADEALGGIRRLLNDLGPDQVEVELVANADGVIIYLPALKVYTERIELLARSGVRFVACANSLRSMGLEREQLLELVEVVPSGVGELTRRQAEGWAYIRP
jgi:intracellular sulfur oxidation DsrE/DsrF family protein